MSTPITPEHVYCFKFGTAFTAKLEHYYQQLVQSQQKDTFNAGKTLIAMQRISFEIFWVFTSYLYIFIPSDDDAYENPQP